jgi:hypothetical protein
MIVKTVPIKQKKMDSCTRSKEMLAGDTSEAVSAPRGPPTRGARASERVLLPPPQPPRFVRRRGGRSPNEPNGKTSQLTNMFYAKEIERKRRLVERIEKQM